MNAIGYVRVSTERQAKEGVSLEAQSAKIKAWAEFNGYTNTTIFVDAGISGKRADNRPGLQQALSTIRKGDALVVYSLSRLARSTKDALSISEQLQNKHADLVSLSEKIDTTSAAGKMVFRVLAAFAEFERDLTSERTKASLQHKRSQGFKTGGDIPYGFDSIDGKLSPNPNEQSTITHIKQYRSDRLSLRAIASKLSEQGILTRNRSNKWSAQTISDILNRDAA